MHTFYEAYIKVFPTQAATLMEETRMQSALQSWHDARKLRLTASTANGSQNETPQILKNV